mmetsp:Transcript_73946/g.211113  ORF Transcript_73946/g.211113 Transcript_73946/m.211113 type:complete len:401 (-) Transcript_73946:622-1824(-)
MVAVSCPVGLPKTDEPAAATSAAHSSGASVGYTSGGGVANGLGNGGGLASSSIGSTHHDTACVWKYLADLSSVRHLPYDDGSSAGADASTNLSGPGGSAVTMNDGATDDGMRADEEQVLYEGAVVVVARRSTPGKPVLPEAAGKLLQRKENGTWDVQLIDANGKKYYDVAPTALKLQDMSPSRPRRVPSPALKATAASSSSWRENGSGSGSGIDGAVGSVTKEGAVTVRLSIEAKPSRVLDQYSQVPGVGYFPALGRDGKTPMTNSSSGSSPFISDWESYLMIYATRPIRWANGKPTDVTAGPKATKRARPPAPTAGFPNHGRIVGGAAGGVGVVNGGTSAKGRCSGSGSGFARLYDQRLILPSFPVVAGLGAGHRSPPRASTTPKGSLKAKLFAPPAVS